MACSYPNSDCCRIGNKHDRDGTASTNLMFQNGMQIQRNSIYLQTKTSKQTGKVLFDVHCWIQNVTRFMCIV